MIVKCPRCGKKNDWASSFCEKCGSPLQSGAAGRWSAGAPDLPGSPDLSGRASPSFGQNRPLGPGGSVQRGYYPPTGRTGTGNLSGGVVALIVLAVLAILGIMTGLFSVLRNVSWTGIEGSDSIAAVPEAPPAASLEKEYQEAGGLQDPMLAQAVEAFWEKPASEITWEMLKQIRYLEITGKNPRPGELNPFDSFGTIYIGLSTAERDAFDSEEAFAGTVRWQQFEPEHLSSQSYPDIRFFSGLTELNLESGYVNNQEYLYLQKLRRLSILLLEDPASLEGLPELSELSLRNTKNLRGIGRLSLDSLRLSYLDEWDFSPVAEIDGLSRLELYRCDSLKDLDFLEEMPELRALSLTGLSQVTDYRPVGTLSELEELTIADSELKRMHFLTRLPRLKKFTSTGNSRLMELPELSECSKLSALTLDADHLKALPDLSRVTGLVSLSLSEGEDLSFLADLPALRELRLDYFRGDLAPIGSLTELERLSIHFNTAGSGTGNDFFQGLTSLRELDVSGSSFYDLLDQISGMQNLETLDLSHSTVGGEFSHLAELPALKKLNMDQVTLLVNLRIAEYGGIYSVGYDEISVNQVAEQLETMTGLTWLSLRGTELSDLSFAAGLPQLSYLDVGDNYLTDLSPVENHPTLKVLIADDNPVE